MRGWALFAAASLVLLTLAACGDDDEDAGRTATATPPAETATAPAEATPTTSPDAGGFVLSSPAFAGGETIPERSTCEGANVSPELAWAGLPDGTVELALIVDDPDAPGGSFIHWVLYAIPAQLDGLAEGAADGAGGENGRGATGWTGPCPPPGDGPHRYVFTLYALSGSLRFVTTPTAEDVRGAVAGITLAETQLTGLYER